MAILQEIKKSPVVRAYRRGWLAWLGANKAAFELAQDGAEKINSGREQLLNDLIEKGETIEATAKAQASDTVQKARDFAMPRLNEVREKATEVRGKIFNQAASDGVDAKERFEELSDEISKLSKTVSALGRKVNTARKPASKKAAPKKATAKTSHTKKAIEPTARTAEKAAEKTAA